MATEREILETFTRCAKQQPGRANGSNRLVRDFVLALAEGEQKGLVGQLWYEENLQKSPQGAIQKAVDAFCENPKLSGLIPSEIHLNPSQVNGLGDVEVSGRGASLYLIVVPDPATLFNHIWVCGLESKTEPTE